MKKIWTALFIFAAATAFAQDTCSELCGSCLDNNESGPCAKVEEICKCTEMIANLKAELQSDASDKTATESVYESNVQSAAAENRQAQDQASENTVFWMGFSLGYESFMEQMEGDVRVDEFYHHLGINAGAVLRWDLYHWLSFITGINAIYHYAEYSQTLAYHRYGENNNILYNNIMVEIPLQFRFALSFEKTKIRPFISASTHIRKPIYVWSDTEVFWKDFDNKGGMYSFLDWEFMEYLGLGIELNRHVAIQWQPLLYSIRTNAYKTSNPYDNGLDTWRLGMEFTW